MTGRSPSGASGLARRSRSNARNRESSTGFTLVEMLVALTLFALLSVFLFGGLRFGNRAVSLGSDVMERASALALAEGFLRQQLAAAQPLPMQSSDTQPIISFTGSPDTVEFVTLPPAYLAHGGFHWLRLAVEDGRLVVRWEPVQAPDDDVPAADHGGASTLLEGVQGIKLSYFGALGDDRAPDWHDRWEDATMLPALVRLRITFRDGRQGPDLVVATRLSETAAAAR